ncbi:ankyrin repeat domain-containing protein [Verrucomicrobium sp. GAS474]|uniref:ankyrin repeat domain-containing protein n=1 Tax=Verrucomicrobium sp. GAS474 TaxID=1882831 RepID=UPI0012FF6BC0|nr:ankyrin repeat domain-containing protein [Verrucomicrobium sp. GAS474]
MTPEMMYDGIAKSLMGDDPEFLVRCIAGLKVSAVSIRLEGSDLLSIAIQKNACRCIESLKRLGFEVDRLSPSAGKHPLEEAIDAKTPVMVEYLLRAGTNPNSPHTRYGTIMHAAAATRLIDSLLPVLLARKGDANIRHPVDQSSPLHAAVVSGQMLNVEQLLDRKAIVNLSDDKGRTPLHLSVNLADNGTIMIRLLDYGADPTAPDLEGKTPLDLAKERGEKSLIRPLEERSAWGSLLTPQFPMSKKAVMKPEPSRIEVLGFIERGNRQLIVNCFENKGVTAWDPTKTAKASPLLLALENRRLDLAALLLAYGLGVNDRGEEKRNVVYYLFKATKSPEALKAFLLAIHRLNPLLLTEEDAKGHRPLKAAIEDGAEIDYALGEELIGSTY